MKIEKLSLLALLTASLAMSGTQLRAVVLSAVDDAEIREQQPERQRGSEGMPPVTTGVQTSGPWTELAVRATGGQNTASLIKFDLTGLTVADINSGRADFRLHARDVDNNNPDGVRVYGVNAGAGNLDWDELTVHYRDSGFHNPNLPSNDSGLAGAVITLDDASCNAISGGNCPPAGTQFDFGANPALGTAAPALLFENAPYSRNAVDRTQGTGPFVPDGPVGTPQPGYATTAASGNYFDIAAGNLPILTRTSEDLDAGGQATLLGYMNWEAANGGATEGNYLHFTNKAAGQDDPSAQMFPPLLSSNESALKAWLVGLLNANETQATLFVTSKHIGGTANEDPAPGRNANKIFNSKERANAADGSDFGAYTPLLLVNEAVIPEPGTLSLLGLCFSLLAVGRRRNK